MNLFKSLKITVCLMLLFITACYASQGKKPAYKTGDIVSIKGFVIMAGNEPFTRMVLRPSDNKETFIFPQNFKKNKNYLIGKSISVEGKIEVKELKSVDHKYTIYEYYIIPEKIIQE